MILESGTRLTKSSINRIHPYGRRGKMGRRLKLLLKVITGILKAAMWFELYKIKK